MRKILQALLLAASLSLSAIVSTPVSAADLHDIVTKGSTDRSVTVDIIDSTDGTPELAVVFNTAGIDLWYRREGAASVDVTEATLAALTTAHADGGFLHVNDGTYRLDLPDAAFATGANYVDFGGTVTGMIVIGGRVRLIDASLEVANLAANVTQFGGTNLTATGGRPEVNTTHAAGTAWNSAAIGPNTLASDTITAAKVAADVGTEFANATWALDATGQQTQGSFGQVLGDSAADTDSVWSLANTNLNATVSSRASQTSLDVVDDFLDTEIAAILAAVDTEIATILAAVDTEVAAILDDTGTSGVQIPAGEITEATFATTAGSFAPLGIARQGTAASATATTLVMDSSAAFADDTAIGMTIVACGSTQGYCQARAVTDNALTGDTLTVDTWTVTPSGTITFYLFNTAPSSGAAGLDAAGVRAAVGLASPNLDTQLAAIDDAVDTEVGAIKTKTDFLPSATAGAAGGVFIAGTNAATTITTGLTTTFTGNLTGSVGSVATGGIAAGSFAAGAITAASTAADYQAEMQGEANDAIVANLLDRLLLNTYDPATPPGAVDSLIEDLVESNAGVTRFTAGALAQAPTGSGESLTAIADAVWDELLSGHAISGSTGEALTSAAAGGGLDAAGVRAAIGLATANLDTQLGDIPTVAEFNARTVTSATYATATAVQTVDDNVDAVLVDTAEIGAAGAGLTNVPWNASWDTQAQSEAEDAINLRLEQLTREDAAILNCEVNTANFAGSTTTLACILTDRDGGAVTAASNDLEGRELLILSGAQIYEGRFINDSTWDAANSELRLTLSRALPATLADAVTAVVR